MKNHYLFTFMYGTDVRKAWAYLKEKGLDVDYTMQGVIVKTFDDGSEAVTLLNKSKDFKYTRIIKQYANGGEIYKHKFMDATAKIIEKTSKGYKVEFTDNSAKKPKAKTMYFNNIDFDKDKGFFEKIMKTGGDVKEEGVDLFEDYDQIPANLQLVLDKHEKSFTDEDYKGLEKALKDVNKLGYTFEYYLDGQAYDLRKIGQKGKSETEQYAKGSTVEGSDRTALENEIQGLKLRISKAKKKRDSYKGSDLHTRISYNKIDKNEVQPLLEKLKQLSDKFNYGDDKFAKGSTVSSKKKQPKIVRGFSDDEEYEYGQGGTTKGFNYSIGGL